MTITKGFQREVFVFDVLLRRFILTIETVVRPIVHTVVQFFKAYCVRLLENINSSAARVEI